MEKGNINWTDARIGDSALVTSENKIGIILKDYGRKFHLRFADGLEKTYDASELNFFNTDDDYETGGDIERGGAHMYIELKDSDIVVYHGDAFKIYKNAKPMFVISGAKKGSWDELWQSIRSIQSSNTDGQKGSAHIYVKLSNGDITVYHGDNVRQFRKLDEDERLFLQKNVRKDSWVRVYNTLMNLKSVKMENGGVVGQEIVFDDNGKRNTGVIKEIHEITGNYIVATYDGRTVLADKELDVISFGDMKLPAKSRMRFSLFKDGGNIEKENKEMIDSQTIEARHHVEELSKILTKKNKIEPWVVARMERATTDLSDVTHYLEGKKMAIGGGLNPMEFDVAVKNLAYSMPNHTSYDYDKGPSEEQVMNAMKKYQKDLYQYSSSDQKKKAVKMVIEILTDNKMAIGGGVGSKLKATYIPNRNIDELKTVFGQSIKGKDLIDGAYTTRKGIKQKPKMARTMFEEQTFEFSKGGGVKNFELDKRLAQITLKVLEKHYTLFGEQVYMNLMNRDLIKDMYKERLPRGFAGPTSYMLIGAILNPLTGKSVHMDGSQLIVGDKAVMTIKYGTTTWKDVAEKLNLQSSKMSTGGAVKKNGVNQFAEDEKSEGYEAKVFLGKFDGRTFKAQSTDKTWDDGTPVTKYFSRNGFKDVKLKGEYQLVDSDRGHWYIQGPRNVWYAVRHKDYGTPPFEYSQGGKMQTGGGVDGVKKYEIIDSNSSKESLNNILDAIHLVNSKGLDLKLIDKTGHYAGGYNHINSVYVNSSMDFSDLVRKFNDILYSNDIYYISIIGVYAKGGSMSGWKHKMK